MSYMHSRIVANGKKKLVGRSSSDLFVYIMVCLNWKSRNVRVFEGKHMHPSEVVKEIKLVSYQWITNRLKDEEESWVKLCNFQS